MEIKQHTDNIVYHSVDIALTVQANILSFASYIGIVALTVDRFLAIHLHLRYQELVTHKRVVAVVSSVWVSGGVTALLSQLPLLIFSAFLGTIATIYFIITGIFYCKIYAAVKKNPCPSSSTEWRHGKCHKGTKICTCYILRLCSVFSLLFANVLCWYCQDHRWNSPVIPFMVFHIHSYVSQFIPQSLDLLLEDEIHSTNCYGYTSKHLSMRSLKKGSINSPCFALVKTKAC